MFLIFEVNKILFTMKNYFKAIAAIMLMTAVVLTACKPENDPNNNGNNNGGGNGTYNGHDYVDLGLPSGTLWATCNVGANTPEEYGDYFAWGETQPKDYYFWSNYRYSDEIEYYGLIKYCNDPGYGYNLFTDTLIVLQPDDDAAFDNWGSDWCTPTPDQWMELINNTEERWDNGVLCFVASNGNSIILPAAGFYRKDRVMDAGRWVHYWSNSLRVEVPADALYFVYGTYGSGWHYEISYSNRCFGSPVRPVCISK